MYNTFFSFYRWKTEKYNPESEKEIVQKDPEIVWIVFLIFG